MTQPRRVLLAVTLFALVQSVALAQAPTPATDAKALLEAAQARGKAEGKNVLIIFRASWCKWCSRMEAFTQRPAVKPFFDGHFVTLPLTVLERGEEIKRETPQGEDLLSWLGGKNAGIPFYAVVGTDGKAMGNSLRPADGPNAGQNIGFPAAPDEIELFLALMRKAAPKATAQELEILRKELLAPPAKADSGH